MSKEKTAFIPKQYFAVVAVLLAIMMSVLDGTIMNIALPTLAHDFDVTPSNAIWIVNAYQLVITMTLLSFASLGDIYGYRRIFLTGISIFAGASLACALSDSFWMLTVSRIIQGFGAACVMSVNTALIRLIYPPQILGRGMGVNAMVVAVSAAAGPSIAGRLVEKVHPGLLGGIGMAIFATGLFTLYLLPPHPAEWNIIWRMALCGMGFGLFQTPNNVTIVSSAPTHRSGGASGMLGTARLLGQTLGTTLVALLFRMFAEGHRAQACLLLAIFFAIAAGVVSSIRMTQASPAGKK